MSTRFHRMILSHRIALFAPAGVLLALTAALPAHGDDTEVFVRQIEAADAGRANILFIIDNSGSMDTELETQADWDPTQKFSGCYQQDAIYFSSTSSPPPCGSEAFFKKSANRCAANAPALERAGSFTGAALAWNDGRERWEALVEKKADRPVECEADRGVDGDRGEDFAANGPDGPWGPDESQEPAWNSRVTLFDGNWLNWKDNPPTVTRTRLQVVQGAVNNLLDGLQDVNVGLMTFSGREGGYVGHAMQDIDTARTSIKTAVSELTPISGTPLSETLYEATLYLRGGLVDYGNVPGGSVAASRVGGDPLGSQYLSPITDDCQKTFIVYLTDGLPDFDTGANEKILALPGFSDIVGSCDGTGDGACLDDLAEYLYRGDAIATLDGAQSVVTYTIGFDIDTTLLRTTAERGGGAFYLADDTASLSAALSAVTGDVAQGAGLFAAPAIPVSAFGRASDARDVYVSLFKPTDTVRWPGNLKKYRFTDGQFRGADEQPVVDPATGFFAEDSLSFWSATVDGDDVTAGGAASRLPSPTLRNVYTDLAGPDLSAEDNRVEVGNTGEVTAERLGVSEEQRAPLIEWIRGADVRDVDGDGNATEARREMGDPLHVRPVTASYGSTVEDPDTVVFVGTNDGLLHAVDADTGVEAWSYLPGRLLGRQYELFLDERTEVRRYGLDGEIRLFNGRLNDEDADRKILVFGMGRGGDAVFALDVTSRNSPRLLWQIDSGTAGFASLGQTWAAPVVTRVDIGGETRTAIVLSGGYDDTQDNRGFRVDTVGNAIFLVDLETGARLWSAGAPDAGHDLELDDMRQSIPAAPRVLDLSGDGLADRLYVGDMGGRVWRVDITNGNSRATLGTGSVLASLGAADLASPAAADVRRFYNTPDVVLVNCERGNFLAVNLGSGYRGHPLDTDVDDAFFSVRDANVFGPFDPDASEPIRIGDLTDITDFPDAEVPADSAGWRLRLVEEDGEKVLTSSVTFDNTIFFQSFAPGDRVSGCSGGLGVNRAYAVGVCNGSPVNNLNDPLEPGPLTVEDRIGTLTQTGIAPEVALLFTGKPGDAPIRCIGLQCFPPEGAGTGLKRTYWTQESGR